MFFRKCYICRYDNGLYNIVFLIKEFLFRNVIIILEWDHKTPVIRAIFDEDKMADILKLRFSSLVKKAH